MTSPRSHRLIRALVVWCRLGSRRPNTPDVPDSNDLPDSNDVAADLTELFESRRDARGSIYAIWRLVGDVMSLALPRRRAAPRMGASGWLVDSFRDLRHGLRLFAKHPGLIGATVGGLSLAIAVCTTVFAILNTTVLRPYGMADPATVVSVRMLSVHGMTSDWPYHAFVDMREHASRARIEASLAERVRFSQFATETADRSDSLMLVSGGYLSTLGARAVRGRLLEPRDDDPSGPPVVVLNYRLWTTLLNSDPDVVGRTVWLLGTPVTVVGVADASFTGPVDNPPAFWAPFGSYAGIFRDRPIDRTSEMRVTVIARIGRGVDGASMDRAGAAQDLSAIAAALPNVEMRLGAGEVEHATGVRLDGASSPMAGSDETEMLVLVGVIFSVVGLVLALACVNVANLLLAGAAARAREIGVRLALGASRGRVLRQLLSESLMIGLVAGAVGLLLSMWLAPIVATAMGLPATHNVQPDARVFLFAASIAVIAGLGAGLAPARHGARGDVAGVLKSDGAQAGTPRKTAHLRRWFIGFQAAASILLLVTAALFLRGALRLTHIDLGFDADRLATTTVAFPSATTSTAAGAYWRTAIERVRAIPSVEGASLSVHPPFGGSTTARQLTRGAEPYRIYFDRTDAAFFDTAGFRLVRGRSYSAAEVQANAPVAVVSESIVRDFLAGAEPIGASLSPITGSLAKVTIVGVVAEAVTVPVRDQGNGTIYRPIASSDLNDAFLVVRAPHPSTVVRDLDRALLAVDSRVRPTTSVMHDDVERYMNEPKVLAIISSVVAGLALVLSVLGLFGVTMFVVSQRTREVQVRRAIGASASDIVRLLVRQSLTPVLIGLVPGLALALAAVRVLTPALSGVDPHDPSAIVGALLVLTGAAVAAVLAPALRAARTNPASVLRG